MIIMATDDLSRFSLQTDDGAPTNVDINAGYWDAMIRGLRDRLHSATQGWEACGRERDQLRKDLAEANGEVDEQEDEVDHLKLVLDGASAQIKRLKGELAAALTQPVPAPDPILVLTSRLDRLEGELKGAAEAGSRFNREHERLIDEHERRLTWNEAKHRHLCDGVEAIESKLEHPRLVALLKPGTGEPAHWASNIREGAKP